MFTGIVEELGKIISISPQKNGIKIEIAATLVTSDTKVGDSIAVNGCCLTVIDHTPHSFKCDIVEETIQKTCFNQLKKDDKINLERSVKLHDRLSGHLVQGHVDGVGKIISKKPYQDGSWWVTISAPSSLLQYLIYKGSITVDGVSLTIAELNTDSFSFAMIPHTTNVTTLGFKQEGVDVNLEIDMIAKYVYSFTKGRSC